MLREKVFKSERARKQALLAGDLAAAHAAQVQKVNALRATGMLVPPGTIPTYLAAADLGARTIRQIAATNAMALEDRVTCENFEELKEFVGNLYGVDLSNTTLLRVPPEVLAELAGGELAEAMALSCGIDEHVVVLPNSGFQSYDLVAHELGHAAEFTLRRQLDTDWCLFNRPIVSETTAYYAQFHHLLAYGNPTRRQGALAAFLPAYLATQYIFTADGGTRKAKDALKTERFAAFKEADCYSLATLEALLRPFEDRPLVETYCLPVEKLFSIPLALKLLYRPLYMRKLAIANFHAPLDDILRELELSPQDVLDFTNLDTPFDAFIAGHRLDQ
ncbi:hypothetical protein [Cupriavidus pauculus]|uniref:hypothetical protein n=1 Tax=Cupriavidus pauculus TaxID=82633 RepID=UPI00124782BD|nr:hypothetical protein [Cupriavidus pauculus]KAB0601042.1 hypothetical protein F7R19_18370 [Cupriavidus pauculus]UAL01972.1 hypothetical protein K8O84_24465 [Cupriavidus pauculus]